MSGGKELVSRVLALHEYFHFNQIVQVNVYHVTYACTLPLTHILPFWTGWVCDKSNNCACPCRIITCRCQTDLANLLLWLFPSNWCVKFLCCVQNAAGKHCYGDNFWQLIAIVRPPPGDCTLSSRPIIHWPAVSCCGEVDNACSAWTCKTLTAVCCGLATYLTWSMQKHILAGNCIQIEPWTDIVTDINWMHVLLLLVFLFCYRYCLSSAF